MTHFYVCARALADGLLQRPDLAGQVRGAWVSPLPDPQPADLVLVEVQWLNPNSWAERETFEAGAGVTVLGDPWETVPAAAIPTLETLRQGLTATRQARTGGKRAGLPAPTDPTTAIDATHTVTQALRKAAPHLPWAR